MREVYGLYSTRSPEIRYVGQTRKGARQRLREHLSRARVAAERGSSAAWAWIRDELAAGQEIYVCVLEPCDSDEQLDRAERAWITRLRIRGMADLNDKPGGYRLPTQERNEKIRERAVEAWQDPEKRERLTAGVRKAWQDPETRARHVESARRGAHRQHHERKGVVKAGCRYCQDSVSEGVKQTIV